MCSTYSMISIPKVPTIQEKDRTPVVTALLEIVELLKEQVQAFKDEIAQLKGHTPKPDIKPSNLDKETDDKKEDQDGRPPPPRVSRALATAWERKGFPHKVKSLAFQASAVCILALKTRGFTRSLFDNPRHSGCNGLTKISLGLEVYSLPGRANPAPVVSPRWLQPAAR